MNLIYGYHLDISVFITRVAQDLELVTGMRHRAHGHWSASEAGTQLLVLVRINSTPWFSDTPGRSDCINASQGSDTGVRSGILRTARMPASKLLIRVPFVD